MRARTAKSWWDEYTPQCAKHGVDLPAVIKDVSAVSSSIQPETALERVAEIATRAPVLGLSRTRLVHIYQASWLRNQSDKVLPGILWSLLAGQVVRQATIYRNLNPLRGAGARSRFHTEAMLVVMDDLERIVDEEETDGPALPRYYHLLEQCISENLRPVTAPGPLDLMRYRIGRFVFLKARDRLLRQEKSIRDALEAGPILPRLRPDASDDEVLQQAEQKASRAHRVRVVVEQLFSRGWDYVTRLASKEGDEVDVGLEFDDDELFIMPSEYEKVLMASGQQLFEVLEACQPQAIVEATRVAQRLQEPELTEHRIRCYLLHRVMGDFSDEERDIVAQALGFTGAKPGKALRRQHDLADQALVRFISAMLGGFWSNRLGVPETLEQVAPEAMFGFKQAVERRVLDALQAELLGLWCQADGRGEQAAAELKRKHGLQTPAAYGVFLRQAKRLLIEALDLELERKRPPESRPRKHGTKTDTASSAIPPGDPGHQLHRRALGTEEHKEADTMALFCPNGFTLEHWEAFCVEAAELDRKAMLHHLAGCTACLLLLAEARRLTFERDCAALRAARPPEPVLDEEVAADRTVPPLSRALYQRLPAEIRNQLPPRLRPLQPVEGPAERKPAPGWVEQALRPFRFVGEGLVATPVLGPVLAATVALLIVLGYSPVATFVVDEVKWSGRTAGFAEPDAVLIQDRAVLAGVLAEVAGRSAVLRDSDNTDHIFKSEKISTKEELFEIIENISIQRQPEILMKTGTPTLYSSNDSWEINSQEPKFVFDAMNHLNDPQFSISRIWSTADGCRTANGCKNQVVSTQNINIREEPNPADLWYPLHDLWGTRGEFHGSDRVEVPDADSLRLTGDLTIAFWVNLTEYPTTNWAIVAHKYSTALIDLAIIADWPLFFPNSPPGTPPADLDPAKVERGRVLARKMMDWNSGPMATAFRETLLEDIRRWSEAARLEASRPDQRAGPADSSVQGAGGGSGGTSSSRGAEQHDGGVLRGQDRN